MYFLTLSIGSDHQESEEPSIRILVHFQHEATSALSPSLRFWGKVNNGGPLHLCTLDSEL
jgi:hypothetical protein